MGAKACKCQAQCCMLCWMGVAEGSSKSIYYRHCCCFQRPNVTAALSNCGADNLCPGSSFDSKCFKLLMFGSFQHLPVLRTRSSCFVRCTYIAAFLGMTFVYWDRCCQKVLQKPMRPPPSPWNDVSRLWALCLASHCHDLHKVWASDIAPWQHIVSLQYAQAQ